MIKSGKIIVTIAIFIISAMGARSQNFSYGLAKDSSAYSDLTGVTTLLAGETFTNKHPGFHLPFSFNFCGTTTDTLVIETNGFIVFDRWNQISLVSFNAFSGYKDSLNQYVASINYTITGSSGNRIVKIEFKNLSMNGYTFYDRISYQVWLYENGNKIEYHIGPNYYSTLEEGIPILIGAINQEMDTEDKAFLISGNPVSPSGAILSGEDDFLYLNNIPFEGTIYRLTPLF
jgi:hypothetical protein